MYREESSYLIRTGKQDMHTEKVSTLCKCEVFLFYPIILLAHIRIIADISFSNSIETGFEVPITDILAAVKEVKAETI